MAEADFTPYGVIYLVTNKANGKVYVGQTTRGIVERWQGHCRGDSYCFALSGAIKKYGKESFSIEVIDSASSKEELDRKEVLHISAYGSASRDKGYNLRSDRALASTPKSPRIGCLCRYAGRMRIQSSDESCRR